MHTFKTAPGVILTAAILSLAGVPAASAFVPDDGCVPPGLFEPTGLVEPVSEPVAETPATDAEFRPRPAVA